MTVREELAEMREHVIGEVREIEKLNKSFK